MTKFKVGDKVKLVRNFEYYAVGKKVSHPGFNTYVGETFTIKDIEPESWKDIDNVYHTAYILSNKDGTFPWRWAEPMLDLVNDVDKAKELLNKNGYKVVPARSGKAVVVEYKPNKGLYLFTKEQWNNTETKNNYEVLTTVDWTEDV